MIEGLQISIPKRMGLVRLCLVISLVFSMLLSFNLWGGQRYFPTTSIIENETIAAPFDFIFLAVVILALIASTLLRYQRLFLFLSLIICTWLVLTDLTRLQPWFYIYNCLLAVYIFYNGRVDDPNKYTSFFILLQIIVASVYFYFGVNQLNERFVHEEFVALISPMKKMVSDRQFILFMKLGYVVPYFLLFIGVGLMISAIRYLAITLAVIMHLLLIIFLFPSSSHPNYALWLSNLTFIFLVLLLFSGKTKQRYFSPTFLFQMPLFYIVLGLFVIMPAFNKKEQWPDFLSSNIASGNNLQAQILVDEQFIEKVSLYERHFYFQENDKYRLDLDRWAREELNSECYPDRRVFNSIYRYLSTIAGSDVKEIELQVRAPEPILRKP